MSVSALKNKSFNVKGRIYTLTVLQLLNHDLLQFDDQLTDLISKAPKLFCQAPVVLDCSALESEPIDLSAFCECLRAHGLVPVAVQAAAPALVDLAKAQGLAVMHGSSSQDRAVMAERKAEPAALGKAKLMSSPIRSGQQIVNKEGDLVITAAVSRGAEVLAEGNIHVYGVLRGRALAGISGNTEARIFCLAMEAELLSIAGVYCLSDALSPVSGPCQIFLQDDRIRIEAL